MTIIIMQFLNIIIQKVSSCSLSVNPLCPKNKATLDMLLVSIDLPFLHIYHNSTIYSLLCLEFLTTVMCWTSYLVSSYINSLLLFVNSIPLYRFTTFCLFIHQLNILIQFLTPMNNAARNICKMAFLWTLCFHLS